MNVNDNKSSVLSPKCHLKNGYFWDPRRLASSTTLKLQSLNKLLKKSFPEIELNVHFIFESKMLDKNQPTCTFVYKRLLNCDSK